MPSLTPLHEAYCKWDRQPLSQADALEGVAQLLTDPILGIHPIIQIINHEMLQNIFGLSDQQSHHFFKSRAIERLQQWSYKTVEKYSQFLVAPNLRRLIRTYPSLHEKRLTPKIDRLISALNGVLGDYLYAQQNPLALPMVVYDHYGELQQGDLAGHVVLFIHGLCMTHNSWSTSTATGIGERLLSQRDQNVMLYLHYNTGRRISANGRSLANILENLVQENPRIHTIDLIGHSMGGLVARSALFYGKQNLYSWTTRVKNLICIGAPHHGAGLERFGFVLQEKLGNFPLGKIIGHLINIRSNGILDLRYGSVRDDDWEYLEGRIGALDDYRKPAPLPSSINTFVIAGTVEHKNHKNNKALKVIGDYLVSITSALGEHPNPHFELNIPESHKAIFYGLNHFELQRHPSIAEQIIRWLYPEKNQSDLGRLIHRIN